MRREQEKLAVSKRYKLGGFVVFGANGGADHAGGNALDTRPSHNDSCSRGNDTGSDRNNSRSCSGGNDTGSGKNDTGSGGDDAHRPYGKLLRRNV